MIPALPPLLKKGDRIAVIAPARKVSAADIDISIKTFRDWDLNVRLSDHLHSNSHSYLAATDLERLNDFQSAVDDPDIKAIICARGGYGSTRILDRINFSPLKEHPKWIIGFSDITAVHLKLCRLNIASIHGIMPILFSKKDGLASIESLKTILFQGTCSITANGNPLNRSGEAAGIVIGGNLSLVVDSLGTSAEPDTTNKILVIEEIDEYLYKIDRMLHQLKRARKFENLSALVVGHMTDIKDTELKFGETVEQLIMSVVKEYSFPVAFSFPSGHEHPNLAWIHGGVARLKTSAGGSSLVYHNPHSQYSTSA